MDSAALTPDEAAAVLRRAAEIQAATDVRSESLRTPDLLAMGSELGLAEDVVRRALAEHRSGPTASPVLPRPVLGLAAEVRVERCVPRSPEAVQEALAVWLRRQWLQRQRCTPGRSTWRPRRGAVADLRRGLDVLHTLHLKGVAAVEVRTEADGDGAHVAVELSLTAARTEALAAMVALPVGVVGGATVLAGLLAGPEALLALPLAGAAGGAGWLGARASLGARRRQVSEAVDGVLDELTSG